MLRKNILTLLLVLAPALGFADDCTLTIEGTDQMKFNLSEMKAPKKCGKVTIKLIHTGKLPRNAMGHNWVLVETKNIMAVGTAAMSAGLENEYVPQGDDRIFAATKVIGGGEETSIELDLTTLDPSKEYSYICTFPGHYAIMKGSFQIV